MLTDEINALFDTDKENRKIHQTTISLYNDKQNKLED